MSLSQVTVPRMTMMQMKNYHHQIECLHKGECPSEGFDLRTLPIIHLLPSSCCSKTLCNDDLRHPTPRISDSSSCYSCSSGVSRRYGVSPVSCHLCVGHTVWGRRTKSSRPKGPQPRSRAPEGPKTSSTNYNAFISIPFICSMEYALYIKDESEAKESGPG